MNKLLLNTSYFPPIQYISKLPVYKDIYIEQYETYGKQSYRNRCHILTANGVVPLSIPVVKTSARFLTKDAEIDYSTAWQRLHFRGIESAYKNSPFYDYYIEEFIKYFKTKEKYLLDYNQKILETLLEQMEIDKTIQFTDDYVSDTTGYTDFRDVIHPKPGRRPAEDCDFISRPYTQTFSDRFPFFPNLSILDLLFNTGPEATKYL